MGKRIDLTGQRFGRLTVVSLNEEVSKQKKKLHWNCKCECGNEVIVRGNSLRGGATTSCGCYNRDKARERLKERWQDEEFREMQSNKMIEQWKDKEFRKMQSNKMIEQWQDEEFRRMKSEASSEWLKEQWQDEEFRKMKSDKTKEQWKDEEFRKMKSEASSKRLKERWQDEEFREMQSELSSKRLKERWQDEDMKWKMGYKGGISPIKKHLGDLPIVKQWFSDSKQQASYTCELTGKAGGVNTHHLKAFSTIVKEAHELHNIQVKPQVKDYTKEELHKLEEYVAGWHEDTSNAVVLCEEAHKLFHSLYGQGGNTPEQFEEFRERYLNGEFKDLI